MPISYITNDPLAGAGAPGMHRVAPRPNRPAGRATLQFFDAQPEGEAQPGTPQFLFWQAREAALAAIECWEEVAGKLTRWQGNRRSLSFIQNAVAQLGAQPTPNAFYNRASFQFFEFTTGAQTIFSGESTDVVSHELGHGLLDSIRPEIFGSNVLEVGAFHEAFADCVAIMTALSDGPSRDAFRARTRGENFLETMPEALADAVRRFMPNHNAAEPRHAKNNLQYQLPTTLPDDGGPGVLINEEHSFARVFVGCFYDLILGMAGANPASPALRTAAINAGKLLLAGAKTAPSGPRFFQTVGRSMVIADQQMNAGANRDILRQAFAGHGIALGSNAMLAPLAALAGAEPTVSTRSATLMASTRRDLLERLGVEKSARISVLPLDLGGARVAHARVERRISLSKISAQLKGVTACVDDSVLVGGSGGRAAILGALPQANSTEDEVLSFVRGLMKHKRIDLKTASKKANRGKLEPMTDQTHEIVSNKGGRELARRAFACGCGRLG